MTPAPNTALTAGDVELLREGDLLRHKPTGWVLRFLRYGGIGVVCERDNGREHTCLRGNLTFLGRPDQEGWIAHQGGENPAPGLCIDVRFRDGIVFDYGDPADGIRWEHLGDDGDITHWRPHAPSQAPAAPSPAPSLGVDLGELRRLAEVAVSVDPIGPGWYTYADLSRWMEPCDARLTEKTSPAVILSLISHIEKLEGRG